MDTKILLAVAALVVVLGGGYWYMGTQTVSVAPEVQQPVVDTTPEPSAAGTVPEGSGAVVDAADQPKVAGYTLAQVAEHATAESCWSTVNGMVYDLTKWIPLHPGGEAKIKALCGKDGTTAFTNKHGGQEKPEATLASYKIGELAQ